MPKPLLITDAIDENLKLVRDQDGKDTCLSLANEGNGAKVTGDLRVTGDIDVKGGVSVPINKEIRIGNHSIEDVSIQTNFRYNDNAYMKVASSDIYSPTELTLSAGRVTTNVPHFIKEQANADIDQAGFGQVWVRSSSPNDLYFTDDTGQDVRITQNGNVFAQYHYETKVIGFNNSGTSQVYLPITGYIVEWSGTSTRNEYLGMVAPFNGTIERAMFRSESAQNGTLEFDIYEASDGTENPGSVSGVKDTAINIADDTSVEIDFSSMTSGTNAFVKGRIYAFRLDTPSAPNDTNVTLVFKWDITS